MPFRNTQSGAPAVCPSHMYHIVSVPGTAVTDMSVNDTSVMHTVLTYLESVLFAQGQL